MIEPHSNLPSRLRETTFHQYEDDIALIVRSFPTVVNIVPRKSIQTHVARLRDAILSLSKFNWPTHVIDIEKFKKIVDEIKVSHNNDSIFAGSRGTLKAMSACPPPPTEHFILSAPKIANITEAKILCKLIADGGVPIATILGLSDYDITMLEENYDVSIKRNPDQSCTIQ